ncbi:Uncharacterised protein [Mycobacteroides abscessus subsp. abscessus]|nr:Uncharacterised protein [Mycobacteroides abscessus subsp. abscessus]
MVWPASVTLARGSASRLAVHAGCFSWPKLLPTKAIRSPSCKYSSGDTLGRPDLRPVVVSSKVDNPSGPSTV